MSVTHCRQLYTLTSRKPKLILLKKKKKTKSTRGNSENKNSLQRGREKMKNQKKKKNGLFSLFHYCVIYRIAPKKKTHTYIQPHLITNMLNIH